MLQIAVVSGSMLLALSVASPAAAACGPGAERCYLQSGKTNVAKRKAHSKRQYRRARVRPYDEPRVERPPAYEFRQSPSYGCNVIGCD